MRSNAGRRKKRKKAKAPHGATWKGLYEPAIPKQRAPDLQLLSELHAAVARHFDANGVTLDISDGTEAIVFGHQKGPRLYVFKDEAVTAGGVHKIAGDFLSPGVHWGELRTLILALQAGRETPELPEMQQTPTSLPSSLPDELRAAALRASAHIRGRAYGIGRSVVLESTIGQIRFEPIRPGPRFLVPFTLKAEAAAPVAAALEPGNTAEPIPIAFQETVDEALIVDAWLVALFAFADLTCVEDEPEETKARVRLGGTRRPASTGDRRRSVPRRSRGLGSPFASSRSLSPIGNTASYAASYVAGHRRRLNHRKHCSDDARAAARAHGIELREGETWVRPHERGVPDDFVPHFTWRVPRQLAVVTGASGT